FCILFIFSKNQTISPVDVLPNIENLHPRSTQASADLHYDLVADLFLTVETGNHIKYRIYELPITKLTLIREYDPPPGVAIHHLST
ncbi:unnamed protein product, partial [Adineta steineri]